MKRNREQEDAYRIVLIKSNRDLLYHKKSIKIKRKESQVDKGLGRKRQGDHKLPRGNKP